MVYSIILEIHGFVMKLRYWLIIVLLLTACAPSTSVKREIQRSESRRDVAELVDYAKSGSKEQRINALKALGNLADPRAIKVLTTALKSASWVERETAVISLGKLKDAITLKPLISVLDDDNRFVRESASRSMAKTVASLIKRKDLRFYRPLIDGIRGAPYSVREQIGAAFEAAYPVLRRLDNPAFIKPLVKALEDEDRYVREVAAKALGDIKNPNAMPALIEAQADKDWVVRDLASDALLNIRDTRAIVPLIEALGNASADIRQGAMKALAGYREPKSMATMIKALGHEYHLIRQGVAFVLGELKDEKAIEPLVKLLDDKNAQVRLAAGKALVKLAWVPKKDQNKIKHCVALQDWIACQALGKSAIGALLLALNGEDAEVRRSASQALEEIGWEPNSDQERGLYCVARQAWEDCVAIGKAAIVPLIQEVQNGELLAQRSALRSLGEIKDPIAIAPLVDMYRNKSPTIRNEIINVLGEFDDQEAFLALIYAIDDTNRAVRETAAKILEGKVEVLRANQTKPVISALIAALKDNNRTVRIVAAKLLGEIKNPAATEHLIKAIGDRDTDVKNMASSALPKIKDTRAIEPLIAALKDNNPDIRKHAVKTLAKFTDRQVIEAVLEIVDDPVAEVRVEIVRALAGMDDPRAIEALYKAVSDEDAKVREMTVRVLAERGNAVNASVLTTLLEDEFIPVREATAIALDKLNWEPKSEKHNALYLVAKRDWEKVVGLGQVAVSPLLFMLANKESEYKVEAARSLGEIGDTRAIDPLIKAIVDTRWSDDKEYNQDILRSVRRALARFGKKASPTLVDSLTNWYIGKTAAGALVDIRWIPRTDKELIHFLVARRSGEKLKSNWRLTKNILLEDVESKNVNVMQNALYAFIGLGKNEVINNLVSILDRKGNIELAEAYLNSGNQKMIAAAKSWASDQGLEVNNYSRGEQPISWGQL